MSNSVSAVRIMFFARPKPREFRYSPRYYKEEKDPERRITFARKTRYDPHRGGMGLFTLLLLLIIVIMLLIFLIPRSSSVVPEKTRVSPEDVVHPNHP